jgi:hypothetical protein
MGPYNLSFSFTKLVKTNVSTILEVPVNFFTHFKVSGFINTFFCLHCSSIRYVPELLLDLVNSNED